VNVNVAPPPSSTASPVVQAPRELRPLTEPIAFEEETMPAFVRTALLGTVGLLVVFMVWGGLVDLDEIASAPGHIVPSGQVRTVEHLEGGIVAEIPVTEGQLVDQGDVLLRFDPLAAQSELQQTEAREASLLLRDERLKATAENRKPDFTGVGARYPDLVADQDRIWQGQVATHRSALEVLDQQINERRAELEQLHHSLAAAEEQFKLTSDQVAIRESGVEIGVVSRQVLLETRRAQVAAKSEVTRLQDQVRLTGHALAEAEDRKRNLGQSQRQDALSELGTVSAEMAQVKGALVKLQDRVLRTEVKAPVRGIVQDIKVTIPGEVVPAGGVVMRIVPVEEKLEAEIRIPAAEIGHVRTGMPVKVKIAAYEFVRYGTLSGTLSKLSASTFSDEQGRPYYKGMVSFERNYVGKVPGENPLLPGMPLDGDIVIGHRSLLSYLLKPFVVSLKTSFHER